jgi:hypothetical protein
MGSENDLDGVRYGYDMNLLDSGSENEAILGVICI